MIHHDFNPTITAHLVSKYRIRQSSFTFGEIRSSVNLSGNSFPPGVDAEEAAGACFGVEEGELRCEGESPKSEAQSPPPPRKVFIVAAEGHSFFSTQ